MKKFLTLILAVLLIASLSVTAFADENTFNSTTDPNTGNVIFNATDTNVDANDTHADVKIAFTGDLPTKDVYQVIVSWKDMTFTYSYNSAVVWNPSTHAYDPDTANGTVGAWISAKDDGTVEMEDAITVKNHSNKAVDIKAGFSGATTVKMTTNDVTAYVLDSEATTIPSNEIVATKEVAKAEGTPVGTPPTSTYKVIVSGTPNTTTAFTVGTITLTISKKAETT